VNESDVLIHVFTGQEEIETTPEHPFWVEGKGFVKAGELKSGDRLRVSDGSSKEVTDVTQEELEEPVQVYNFEVEDWHTYYVSEAGVLVHNDCTAKPGQGAGKATNEPYIPKDANGNPISLSKQTVNGQDIPLPDPAAQGSPHTVIGGKTSSGTGEVYRQSATFPKGTWPKANGQDVPWSEIHWSDHGTPQFHTNPHQHIFEYNPDKGGWIRGGPSYFKN